MIFVLLFCFPCPKVLSKLNVGNAAPLLKQSHFRKLASMTEGYSGADISVLVRDAMMQVFFFFFFFFF